MADDATEPGAPTPQTAAEESEKVTSKEVQRPNSIVSAAKQIDSKILRLNKLIASPGGLSASLSTLNYTLYILTYLQLKSPSLQSYSRSLLSRLTSRPLTTAKHAPASPAGIPPIAALATMLSQTRTTLRLLGLLPLYTWFRSLLAGPKPSSDIWLHRIALTQCTSYLLYQFLENICVLADAGIVSPSLINTIHTINRSKSKGTAKVYLWAYRFWFGGVLCDFLRLAREAQIENKRRRVREQMRKEGRAVAEYQEVEDGAKDGRWWNDVMIATAWAPMALNFSREGGLPGWNLGLMGICGLVAGGQRWAGLWEATAR